MKERDVHHLNLQCVRSYIYYHESHYYKKLIDKMLAETNYKWCEAVRWWISNSARAMRANAAGFTYGMKASSYSNRGQGIGYRQVKSFVSFLEQHGYIDIYKGFVVSWKMEKGRPVPDKTMPSLMIFKKRTLEMWQGVDVSRNLWKEVEVKDSAVIRNRETKELMNTRGVAGIGKIKMEVNSLNNSLQGADIKFQGKVIADVAYRRVFSGDLETGGRLYSVNGGVQLLPQRLRASALEIDGEPVVELDYSSIHPNIAYQRLLATEGLNVYDMAGEDFSPYNADLSFVHVDSKLKREWEGVTGKEHNPLRQLAKLAILIGMNSDDERAAAWTLGNKVKEDRAIKNIEDQDFYALVGNIEYGKVLLAVKDHNDLIKDSFYSDSGILLQNYDSRIMMEIVGAMGEKGHTMLAYHDSVLVKVSAEEDLRCAMFDAWSTVFGDITFCKVDKK